MKGFPRTKEQAEILYAQQPIDVALNLVVPFEVIIERVSGRWVHLPSGRVYNVGFEPPKVPVNTRLFKNEINNYVLIYILIFLGKR